jgi:nucleoside-diphosphate-sugar epimerase
MLESAMRVLILGGTRFMGPAVARRLLADGHEVTVFHRGQTLGDLPPEVEHLYGERGNLSASRADFERLAPEVVLDMIAFTERDAQELTATFRELARRVVVISSQDVYRAYGRLRRTEPGPPDPVPLDEAAPLRERPYPYRGETPRAPDDPQRWQDEYDKIPVERVVMSEPALPATVLRLSAVYGPGDEQHRVGDYLRRMDVGRRAIVLDDRAAGWRWTHGYVENVADAIALAATDERAAGETYNVGEENALSMAEWVRAIGRAAGWTGRVATVPRAELPASLVVELDFEHAFVSATGRIRQELGYAERVTREEGLRRSVAWERARPQADAPTPDYAAEDEVLARLG